jgi:8-oxo-dGTP diphosphatase
MPVSYEFPRPLVTVDCVVLGVDDRLKVLLLERDNEPHAGRWALPGGVVREGRGLDEAAADVLRRKVRLTDVYLEQLYTFGAPGRDPRGHVISVAYYALVRLRDHEIRAATGAREVTWAPVGGLPALPFDHARIVETATARLRGKVTYDPRVVFALMPSRFTLPQLQQLYEAVLDTPLDKRNFRRKVLDQWGILAETDDTAPSVAGPPARLYAFDEAAYAARAASGFQFLL